MHTCMFEWVVVIVYRHPFEGVQTWPENYISIPSERRIQSHLISSDECKITAIWPSARFQNLIAVWILSMVEKAGERESHSISCPHKSGRAITNHKDLFLWIWDKFCLCGAIASIERPVVISDPLFGSFSFQAIQSIQQDTRGLDWRWVKYWKVIWW